MSLDMNKRHADTDPPADMNKRHAGPDPAADHFFTIASQVRAASALDSRPHDNSSASASSSPPSEEQLQFADRFLAGSLHDHDVAPPPVVASSHEKSVTAAAAWEAARSQAANGGDDDVTITCETYTCVGGKWFGGTVFEPCVLKKQTHGFRHARSVVCTIHHNYVKCISCSACVHEGCHAPALSGYSLPQRNVPWKCLQCTLKPSLPPIDTKEGVSKPEGDADDPVKSKSVTKCMFGSKVELQDTLRQMNWKIRSGKPRDILCICAAGLCKQSFKVKCADDDTDGMWCAINMPSVHECGGKRAPIPVTSRVCNLPVHVYKEIQNLACCKAFKPASIQQYIKQKHGIIVDTTLIYNIGYRARSKLGIGDMEKLLSQQQVMVYTFSTSSHTSI